MILDYGLLRKFPIFGEMIGIKSVKVESYWCNFRNGIHSVSFIKSKVENIKFRRNFQSDVLF